MSESTLKQHMPWVRMIAEQRLLLPWLLWSLGMISVFNPMLFSGLELMHGGLGDARLVNYTLEHGYLWLVQSPTHESFWDAPLYWPYPNVSAFTDVMLGVGPFYWVWRLIGAEADTAFQLFLLVVWSLNFAAAFYMLRRCLGVGFLGASAGAYLIAFGGPKLFGHVQLAPVFYVLLAVVAAFEAFRASQAGGSRRANAWIAAFVAACVLQVYTAVYTFFFYGLVLGFVLVWACAHRATRTRLTTLVRQHWHAIGAALLFGAVAVWPLVEHYLITASTLGFRGYRASSLPQLTEWFLVTPGHVLNGWISRAVASGSGADLSQAGGVGVVTLIATLAGLWSARRRGGVRLVALSTGTLILVATAYGDFSPWQFVHAFVPGAGGIRDVSRVTMIIALPAAMGLALATDRTVARGRYLLAAFIVVVSGAEQLKQHYGFVDKHAAREHISSVAADVDESCDAFLLVATGPVGSLHLHDEAAWVQLATGIPTVNGRYGNAPNDWGLRRLDVSNDMDRERVEGALASWARLNRVGLERICWVETRGLGTLRRIPAWPWPVL